QLTKSNGRDIIDGWIDLNGPKGPNIYGRDLRTFSINLRQGAAFTQEDPGSVIISAEPTPCEGENCGIDDDPCKLFPQGEECCKKAGKILKDENDVCCPWYMSPSDSPNYIICNPDPTICDPSQEECDIQKCLNHTVTGPDDACCTILEVSGHPDPLCCKVNSSSTYCCKLNPNTEACCEARLSGISDYSTLNQNDYCCKIASIKEKYSFCQDLCSKDYDSEECCKTIARRNEVNNPDDACCKYDSVNGIDKSEGNTTNRNDYCCRLPENNSDQCCIWKYNHIGSSDDYYSDSNSSGGTYDSCCNGEIRGIKYTEGNTDNKSKEVLKRCCSANKVQPTDKEEELCCNYLVNSLGVDKLRHGESLRRCCKYNSWKNKPQCCSHENDGMAYDSSVGWNKQCCMPNDIYNNNVAPSQQCCGADIALNNNGWSETRAQSCCEYTGLKNIQNWQKSCCHKGSSNYPSKDSYNTNCCTVTKWSSECCTTSSNSLPAWQANCCNLPAKYPANSIYRTNCCTANTTDYTRSNNSSSEYCCHPDAPNPKKECCTIFKNLGSGDTWKDRDGNSIGDAYKLSCCKDHGVCPDSCAIRSQTGKSDLYDFPRCCADSTVYSRLSTDNTLLTSWKTKCCGSNKPSGMSDDDYKTYCCKEKTSTATWGGGNNNMCCRSASAVCCDVNKEYCTCTNVSTESGKANWKAKCCSSTKPSGMSDDDYKTYCCKDETSTATWGGGNNNMCCRSASAACCDVNQAYCTCTNGSTESGKDNWKAKCCGSTKPSGMSDADYKTYCCKEKTSTATWGGGNNNMCCQSASPECCAINASYCADCEMKYNNNFAAFKNDSSSCCKETTSHKSDNKWKETCCPGNKGNLSESGCGGGEYRTYCCMQDGSGHYHGGGDTQTTKCCIPGVSSDYCCKNKGKDYCGDCEGQYSSYPTTFDTGCCSVLSISHKSEKNWQEMCCAGNKGKINQDGGNKSEYAKVCCANMAGIVTGGDTDTTNCCDIKRMASEACCNVADLSSWSGTKCCGDINGQDYKGTYKNPYCCKWDNVGSDGTGAPASCCASSTTDFYRIYPDEWRNVC
ncbi:MAG: hypothetical protein IKN54_09585, partial [Lachnospiraceae bacterium]|nr:hypothetical protein [Lachnospiraceae bacterium]